jgi:hypothetical protein
VGTRRPFAAQATGAGARGVRIGRGPAPPRAMAIYTGMRAAELAGTGWTTSISSNASSPCNDRTVTRPKPHLGLGYRYVRLMLSTSKATRLGEN